MRLDWRPSPNDAVTFQGDYYNGYSGETDLQARLTPPYSALVRENIHVSGGLTYAP